MNTTQILNAAQSGDHQATEELFRIVYHELREMARIQLRDERSEMTLGATAVVHEAFLRMVDRSQHQNWNSRGHFVAAAAEAMRRLVIDHARAKATQKRGGNWSRLGPDAIDNLESAQNGSILFLDEALERLERIDPENAMLVKYRFFVGLTMNEIAQMLGIAISTAEKRWAFARSWLKSEMRRIRSETE